MVSYPGLNIRRTKTEKNTVGIHPILLALHHSDQKGRYPSFRIVGFCHCHCHCCGNQKITGSYTREQRRGNKIGVFTPLSFSMKRPCLFSQRDCPVSLCVHILKPTYVFWATFSPEWRKQREKTLVNSWLVRQYFEFWSCSPIHLLLFTFHIPEIAASCIPPKFYSCIQ